MPVNGNIIGVAAHLRPLADNGGASQTHALLTDSPALDAGSSPWATADQRGFPHSVDLPRIANTGYGCDVGAYESQEEPINGLSASNDGATALGQSTNFSTSLSSGTSVSYLWDFGDEGSGTGPVPSHTFATTGIYTVTVTSSNLVSNVTATTTVEVKQYTLFLPIVIR